MSKLNQGDDFALLFSSLYACSLFIGLFINDLSFTKEVSIYLTSSIVLSVVWSYLLRRREEEDLKDESK